MSDDLETYELPRADVLALQLAEEKVRRARAELEVHASRAREAQAELQRVERMAEAVRAAATARATDNGQCELVGELDPDTCKGKRRRKHVEEAVS